MSKYIIEGGNKLKGEVVLQGAKNSALPILAATLLVKGQSLIHNCPNLSDVDAAIKILTALGCKCSRTKNDVYVDSTTVSCSEVPSELMSEMRSSVVFLGAILARCSKSTVTAPGGCELGPRPIDLHLKAMEKLGFSVDETYGYIFCERVSNPENVSISLDFPSVGATENIILASCVSKSRVIINNAAKEPEIVDLAGFINKAGGRVVGAGTHRVEIIGVDRLHSVEHSVISDRIVAATYMSAVAANGGRLLLKNANLRHMDAVLNSFGEMGCDIKAEGEMLKIEANQPLRRIQTVRSMVYPGFPTDAGPLLVSALTLARGTSVFTENIFENRFNYVSELRKLGADIKLFNKTAVIEGVSKLYGARVVCTDLRGGAAVVIAALASEGRSIVEEIHHIERGYDNFDVVLRQMSANIVKE